MSMDNCAEALPLTRLTWAIARERCRYQGQVQRTPIMVSTPSRDRGTAISLALIRAGGLASLALDRAGGLGLRPKDLQEGLRFTMHTRMLQIVLLLWSSSINYNWPFVPMAKTKGDQRRSHCPIPGGSAKFWCSSVLEGSLFDTRPSGLDE